MAISAPPTGTAVGEIACSTGRPELRADRVGAAPDAGTKARLAMATATAAMIKRWRPILGVNQQDP
jgi:hypothetical protein